MKPSSKRTLKKAFLNITAGLCAIVFTGNVIAGECAGQINSALGTATSKVVSTLAEGETEGYARYFESKYNSIAELKAAGEAKVREVGELIGEDAMWAGYAGLYGTGLNIHRSPYAGRVFEYYSEDGTLTGLVDAAETLGLQSKGVYVYNKHFVLNDQENNRAGIATWVNEQALRENYLRAFELPIVNADAKCVMTAFNRLGAQWAGAYTELLTDWLRGEAGMEGFAVTDMYDDTYMVKANEVVAGNDIPDNYVGDDISQFAAYGPNGTTPNAAVAQALRTSSKRVLYTVLHSRGMDGISSNTQIVSVTPWWQMTLNVAQWTLTGLTALALLLLLLDMAPRKKKKA